ncbi:MAG: site-specific DNA-methyltransferase [Deltaproteobacteria bacterium]|jgi:adenine-specific DNA-methyltransferase|nr:site-specific DNA-methyltransferase [Deltaproteobacteria bacterium]
MEKLKLRSRDLIQDNVEKLRELFPECVVDSFDAAGDPLALVDFDRLRLELADRLVEGPSERYRLDWPGKAESVLAANAPIAKTLRPRRAESVGFETTRNLYLEGDNLDALKLLGESYRGKIKLIYVDPPYNTGSDLIYADDFKASAAEYLYRTQMAGEGGERLVANAEGNGRFHSDWLSMAYSRLRLARGLLTEDGSIFVSVDDHEADNLKKILVEIFGERNFVAQACVKGTGGRQDSRHFAVVHSYLVVFAKDVERFAAGVKSWPAKSLKKAEARDGAGPKTRLLRKWGDKSRREDRPNLYYPIKDPDGQDHYPILADQTAGRWRWGQETMRRAILGGRVVFKKVHGQWVAYEKVPEMAESTAKFTTWIDNISVNNAIGSIKELFNGKIFDYPKSLDLIKIVLKMGSVGGEDIVLDFFSGSATTAHAVLEMNAQEGLSLRFIMVQLPERCGEKTLAYQMGFKNIAEIGKERIRRAGQKLLAAQANLGSSDLLGSKSADEARLDVGFRVLKVDSPNLTEAYYAPDRLEREGLRDLADLIKPDRSAEDLLFQALLAWGLDLSLAVKKETVSDDEREAEIFVVGQNALIAAFDSYVSEGLALAIASRRPEKALLASFGLASDSLLMSAQEIFRRVSPTTDLKTI